MCEWLLAIIAAVLYAALWFWYGCSFGKDAALRDFDPIELDKEDADALGIAARADGMPTNEWIVRQAVAEARRRYRS